MSSLKFFLCLGVVVLGQSEASSIISWLTGSGSTTRRPGFAPGYDDQYNPGIPELPSSKFPELPSSRIPELPSRYPQFPSRIPESPKIPGSPLGIPSSPSRNPEEAGECSHWGDPALSQHEPVFAPGFGQAPFRGDLIGSHRNLPVGTTVIVTNMKNGRTITVRVVPPRTTPILGRVMDLSPDAFKQLANLPEGVFTCSVRVLQPRTEMSTDTLTSHLFENGIKSRPTAFEDPRDTSGYENVDGLPMFGRNENDESIAPNLPVRYH